MGHGFARVVVVAARCGLLRARAVSRLGVLTRAVGLVSETFIARHACELVDGGSPVVSRYGVQGEAWRPPRAHAVLQPRDPRTTARLLLTKGAAVARGRPRNYWPPTGVQKRLLGTFLRDQEIDVVLAEYLDLWVEWVPVLKKFGVRVFVHAHGHDMSARWLDRRWRRLYAEYGRADGIIVVNRSMKQRLESLGLEAGTIHRIPYGVDIPPRAVVRPARRTVHCLAVGRMVAKKAPLVTLEAFERAYRKNADLRLTMVGAGPLEAQAAAFVRRHGLDGVVALRGAQPPDVVQTLLQSADVFLQHSVVGPDGDEEGMPVVILEAMAHALPVLSTRHAGIPEAVKDEETGLLVEEGDIAAMTEALIRIAADVDMRHRLGEAGWSRARRNFAWQVERDALRELLFDGVAGRPDHGRGH